MIEPTNWWKTKLVMFIAEHTPKCHDITRLISQSMDEPLTLRSRCGMWIHYRICIWCERYRDQLDFLRKALRASSEDPKQPKPSLSPQSRTRLKIALKPKE